MGRKEDFLTNDYATENVVLDMAGTYTVISHNGYNNTHPGLHSKSSNCSSSSSGSAQEEKRWRKYCGKSLKISACYLRRCMPKWHSFEPFGSIL